MERQGEKGRELVFRPNDHGEQLLLGAMLASREYRKAFLNRHPADRFLVDQHRCITAAMRDAERQGLDSDPATLNRLSGGRLDIAYLAELIGARPAMPDPKTLEFHEEQLVWDHQRYQALVGPVASLLESMQAGDASSERVRALARAVGESFQGGSDRRYLRNPDELHHELVTTLRARREKQAIYPYGIKGLDEFEDGTRRITPGAKPGTITVVTGVSGSGKSTVTALAALGLARDPRHGGGGRKVLYGAWEMDDVTTLELLACQQLGLSRSRLIAGDFDDETLGRVDRVARKIGQRVMFLKNPFRRKIGERSSNERNLDVVAGYIADSGCDVFIADLWKRCLARADPDDEEEALYRQHAILEELQVHGILVQQQRLKDIEQRPDKRPTREGVKGSGAWVEVADTMIGVHRPHMWKPVPDDTLELLIMKQRYGRAPLAIEFEWDADRGIVRGGRAITYERADDANEGSSLDRKMRTSSKEKKT